MTPLTSQTKQPQASEAPASHEMFAAGPHATLPDHEGTFGKLLLDGIGADFIGVLEQSGLTGRGGAAFVSWRKVSATAHARDRRLMQGKPVVIANGAEGEPLSFKDKTLLAHAPHLVLDGLLIAGRAVSASSLYIFTTTGALPAVEAAIAERSDSNTIKVVEAPETFISGQASAVVNAIGSGNALPLDQRHRLSESGLRGRPTLVLNVETLAHIALIARYGAGWFRSAGSERDPGTRLVSVSGPGAKQVVEVNGDVRLLAVLDRAGIDTADVQAILIGGYRGRWVKPLNLRLSPSGTADESVRPGAGVVHVLSHRQCGLRYTAQIVKYLARQSAKQCGPCVFGLPAMAKIFGAIARGDGDPHLIGELGRLGTLVSGRGACHHPDGTLQLIDSALEVFADDIEAHLRGKCTELVRTTL